jgi:hypothetical protein
MEMHNKRGLRTFEEIENDAFFCPDCGWEGRRFDRIHSRLRGYICPRCYSQHTQRVKPIMPEDIT